MEWMAHSLNTEFKSEAEITQPLTLEKATELAIKNNLDLRIKRLEKEYAETGYVLSKLEMLPELTAEMNASTRSKESGASSMDVTTGAQNLNFSRSSEDTTWSAAFQTTFNVLETGLNFVRAQQQSDVVKIAQERRRVVRQGIIRDVRIAYTRALVAQILDEKLDALRQRTSHALELAKEAQDTQLKPALTFMKYQKNLLNIIAELDDLRLQLDGAKIELSTFLNLHPGQEYTLSTEPLSLDPFSDIGEEIHDLEIYAMLHRPEIIEEDYNYRIENLEKRYFWINNLPLIEPNLRYNYDSNSFLLNHSWMSLSAKLAYNLLDPLVNKNKKESVEQQVVIAKMKRDAQLLAVLAQVNISYLQHQAALQNYNNSNELKELQGKITGEVAKNVEAEIATDQELVISEAESFLTEVENMFDYINVQRALANMMVAIGYDVVDIDDIHDTMEENIPTQDLSKTSMPDSETLQPPVKEPLPEPENTENTIVEEKIEEDTQVIQETVLEPAEHTEIQEEVVKAGEKPQEIQPLKKDVCCEDYVPTTLFQEYFDEDAARNGAVQHD